MAEKILNPEDHLTTELGKLVLGQTHGQHPLHTPAEHLQASTSMAAQARRHLYIFTYDLDSMVYGQPSFVAAAKQFIITNHRTTIRILLQDNIRVQREGHQLLNLWQRLTSQIEIRRPHHSHLNHPENFLIADGIGYIHRKLHGQYHGIADFHAPLEIKQLNIFFSEAWDNGEPDTALRRLNIL